MTQEGDQLIQRRENLAELVRLGVDPYPHRFDRTDTIVKSTLLRLARGSEAGLEASGNRLVCSGSNTRCCGGNSPDWR